MNNELVRPLAITLEVPNPPDGWKILSGRQPSECEQCKWLSVKAEWVTGYGPPNKEGISVIAFCSGASNPKRLLRPEELTGKWLRKGSAIRMVIAASAAGIIVAGFDGWESVEFWKQGDWLYSGTPDGECLPLETDVPFNAQGGQQ